MLLDALSCGTDGSGHFAADIHARADRNQVGIRRHYGKSASLAI